MAGDSIEEAHKKAAGTAIASGAVGLALSKLMPGGAQALNNPATKKAFSSAVKSFAKGGAEEISQGAIEEGFTHIASEMNKGKTFNEAATSFAEQFPQSALTSALLGGGIETAADHRQTSDPTPQQLPPQQPAPANPPTQQQPATANPPASAPQQPPSPSQAQQPIPQASTPGAGASGSGQQPQTTANNRPPPQTPSPSGSAQQPQTTGNDKIPSQTPPASGSAQQPQTTANNSKQPPTSPAPPLPPPTTAPKSPEQSQRLINNVMNRPPEQRGHPQVQSDVAQAQSVLQDHVQKLENQTEPLNDAQKKELTDAKATLSRLPAEKPVTTPERTLHPESATPHSRGDSDGWTPQADTRPNDARPGRKIPADAEPPLPGYRSSDSPQSARNRPDGRPLEPSYPGTARDSSTARNAGDTTPYHPATLADSTDATNPQTADRPINGTTPDQVQNASANQSARPTDYSRQPAPTAQGTPPTTTANGSQPSSPSRTSLPPPRTPPLSVPQSQRLIDNVSKMPPEARQHPQVQADLAQAEDVVNAQSPHKTVAGDTQGAPPKVREPEAHGAIPPPGNLPPKPAWVSPTLVAHWNGKLEAARVRDPADHTEILEHLENLGPISRLHVYRAVQSFLDLLPGDITRSLPRIHMRGESAANIKEKVGHDAQGAWWPSSVDKVHRGHGVFQEVAAPATILISHDLYGDETALRTTVWHEMTHWLWDEAGRADAPPRLAQWRQDLEQHFRERTANDQPKQDKEQGFWFLPDHWIENYSGKISNKEPTAQLLANPPVIELATTYMENFAVGGLGAARWEIVKDSDSTFNIVFSILGDK